MKIKLFQNIYSPVMMVMPVDLVDWTCIAVKFICSYFLVTPEVLLQLLEQSKKRGDWKIR